MTAHDGTFARGAVVISIDTEQIWGHFDMMSEEDFCRRYPNSPAVNARLLEYLCMARISATLDVVGGLSLDGCDGEKDPRLSGLPKSWVARIPPGDEISRPLWYRRSFVCAITDAVPDQEIALHGGLTHMVWRRGEHSPDMLLLELVAGTRALKEIGVQPRSFVFPRDLEGSHELLGKAGIECYRGRAAIVSEKLGYNVAGSVARAAEELVSLTPPPVWPKEVLPHLWNLPASLFIYSMGRARARWIPLRLRLERVRLGVERAIERKGIFHIGLHPENLAESEEAFGIFESIVAYLARMREEGLEILTMSQALDRTLVLAEG
jgi:hypothetical protein